MAAALASAEGISVPDRIIREGSRIILDVNDDKHVFIVVKGRNKVKLGQAFCSILPIIGCPYGATFGVAADGKTLQQIPPVVAADWQEGAVVEVTKNNSQLVDAGDANQQLTSERIAALRSGGADGAAIVEALAAHSATFDTKTEFSQAKYRKKKSKKYVVTAVARRPTAASIAEAYFRRQPGRIGHLRLDTLSLLLSLANVSAHAHALVLDTCGGLVLGAAAERMGGHGAVTGVFLGRAPPSREALAQFDEAGVQRGVREARLEDLLAAARAGAAAQAEPGVAAGEEVEAKAAPKAEASPDGQGSMELDVGTGGAATATAGEPAGGDGVEGEVAMEEGVETEARGCAGAGSHSGAAVESTTGADPSPAVGPQRASASPKDLAPVVGAGGTGLFNACIVAAPGHDPGAALRAVLPLLSPSTPFAVYSPWSQPLAEVMQALRAEHAAVGLTLQESWWREQQVLPSRTHPKMQMNHGGGFVLSGTTVAAPGPARAPEVPKP